MLLADHNGFKIIYLRLRRMSCGGARDARSFSVFIRMIQHSGVYSLSATNSRRTGSSSTSGSRSDDSKQMLLRRIRVGVEAVRTATEQMATLEITESEESSITADELQCRHDKAFDVESVTKAFFRNSPTGISGR